ncbi:unnamed protein product [Acanthoscelides obtectus]|uniref:Uncharacterized protein n=1 Tax=Acanthoscelides obtectus TaxID=200917 RepID=A0A9P0K8N5_ACAOB|nr:unnamed protein product [Acanthoscelides obtectus]CAK1642991.1 hypothetical protein AOBTE_LOCUS13344 [Acanthoscelides obtectus]
MKETALISRHPQTFESWLVITGGGTSSQNFWHPKILHYGEGWLKKKRKRNEKSVIEEAVSEVFGERSVHK